MTGAIRKLSSSSARATTSDYPSTIMHPWSALEESGVTLRVRLGMGGKEIGPVLEDRKGTIVFVGGDIEEEALAVRTDIIADHAQAIDAN